MAVTSRPTQRWAEVQIESALSVRPGPSVSFVGHKAELALLEAPLRDLSEARSVTIYLHGASGFG